MFLWRSRERGLLAFFFLRILNSPGISFKLLYSKTHVALLKKSRPMSLLIKLKFVTSKARFKGLKFVKFSAVLEVTLNVVEIIIDMKAENGKRVGVSFTD